MPVLRSFRKQTALNAIEGLARAPLCGAIRPSVVKHLGEGEECETLWRFLTGLCDMGPRLLRMGGREPGPVVMVDLGEIFGDLLVVENQARVAVRLHPFVRPFVTAKHRDRLVDDDAFVVAGGLKAERPAQARALRPGDIRSRAARPPRPFAARARYRSWILSLRFAQASLSTRSRAAGSP